MFLYKLICKPTLTYTSDIHNKSQQKKKKIRHMEQSHYDMSDKSQEARIWLLKKLDDSRIILKMTCFDSLEISINTDTYLRNKVMNFKSSACTHFPFSEIIAEQTPD